MPNKEQFPNPDIWCVIPVYNNKTTVTQVALECRQYLTHVLVVDDGSTDADIAGLFNGTDIRVIRHPQNMGKGRAIRTALEFVLKQNGKFMLTIDADGQHYPQDIPKFIAAIEENKDAIIIGYRDFSQKNVPAKSQFGRAFSNFWLRLETGCSIADSQSGYRCYPVGHLSKIKASGNYYDFEIELLIRASWSGIKLKEVPVNVFYAPAHLRVSSFHPFKDNLRITLVHIRLIGRRLMPLPYPKIIHHRKNKDSFALLFHPVKLLEYLLKENATPLGLAVAAGTGIFLGVLPLLSVHMLAVLYVASRLHLNKIMALSVQNLCMPPFVPAACIELGHLILHKKWLTEISWNTFFSSIPERIWEWFLGSLFLAPLLGIISGVIIYFCAAGIQRKMVKDAQLQL